MMKAIKKIIADLPPLGLLMVVEGMRPGAAKKRVALWVTLILVRSANFLAMVQGIPAQSPTVTAPP
ncbi:MAG: hypothetical protein LKE88_03450 [Acidaminococcus provencensis]|uniref:hypothetical protein n=1 Tax=Acidaminococcus provencensis TaxID=2058289 RepID=UPI0023F05DB3|nr:hypothetical protein [Acidaminococcus provencensis]MCH4095695.1 hypothetical protein [Acidaminococcus provencensis]